MRLILLLALLFSAADAFAHFGMVIPSRPVVTPERKSLELTLSFSHPAELVGMPLVRPKQFFVVADGQRTDLLPSLAEARVMDHQAWKAQFAVKRPAVYQFVMEPTPYWEPAEDLHIIHYTKVVVPAFGADGGWDEPLGLKTEIQPLLRPFGNSAGNSFVGRVLRDGKPVPHAEVEVERYNSDGAKPASDYHITQLVKADADGVFVFTCPQKGWWGFAALTEGDFTLKDPAGKDKGVELGAVMWIWLD